MTKILFVILSLAGCFYLMHIFYPSAWIPSLPVPFTVYMFSPGMLIMGLVLYMALKMNPGK